LSVSAPDESALLDKALNESDGLLSESLRSEERRRRRRRIVTLSFLIGGVLMSVIVTWLAAGWLMALGALDQASAKDGSDKGQKQSAPVDRQKDVERAESLEQQGWQLWQNRDFDEATAKFQAAVKLDPDAANAWNGLGWSQLNSGKAEA